MHIPFVIDNHQHKMADVLNAVLAEHAGLALDIATAYFNVGGWALLQVGLQQLGQFRLLLGAEPETGADLGLREVTAPPVRGLIRDLAASPFNPATQRLVEDLIAFLQRDSVDVRLYTKGFLHAKCYLFYSGGGFAHFTPVAAIVGSSNFTRPGLTTNKELNLSHRAVLAPEEIATEQLGGLLDREARQTLAALAAGPRQVAARVPGVLAINDLAEWYDRQWDVATDFKQGLIDLLDASKFGRKEYTPYEVYLKAMFELFREEVEPPTDSPANLRSVVDLSEFQEDAVKKARKILARYDGVLIGDSVGLGKTWIGKKLLEDYAYHLRYRALVICPAALRGMWERELRDAGIAARVVTQESLGREEYDIADVQDADLLLVDESHNFRNRNAQRYEALERILAANGRRGGRSGERKKLILLTATPINNTVFDLYNQIALLTGGDRSYFAAAGIGDLHRYFLAARQRARQQESGIALYNLLEEVVIRRTRPFIKEAYPNATIGGKPIHWPERRLKTVHYNLEATYAGIYETVVQQIESLRLAPYRLESYKKQNVPRDVFEEGREEALAGIFKSRYLKRFESSVAAFRISVRRALEFLETFESYVLEGRVLDSSSFQKAMRFLAREDEEDDATPPGSQADQIDAQAEARAFIETLPTLDAARYDLRRLHSDIRKDVAALSEIWRAIASISPEGDAKLAALKECLAGDLRGQKVLIFTYYKDTARYLAQQLTADTPAAAAWRAAAEAPHIRRMDSGADARERAGIVSAFAPHANNRPDLAGTPAEINILISTDVLSEGQNLQDCGVLINYDLHWNPTRMVQRAGRIDRIGSTFATLWVLNMFPDHGLERLLGLVQSLSEKIAHIDNAGFLDASVLGEVVHPQNFNTLRRIEAEDGQVVQEQEQFVELVSSEFLIQNLKNLLDGEMRTKLEQLPDGIHSGLARPGVKGIFFYFKAPGLTGDHAKEDQPGARHFWRYVDLAADAAGGRIEDNRYVITNLIQCQPDEPRVVPAPGEVDIFALQEKVIASIVQSTQEQVALEEAPKVLDPIQQTIVTILRSYINSPAVERKAVIAGMQKLLEPQPGVYIKALKKAHESFLADSAITSLLAAVQGLGEPAAEERPTPAAADNAPIRRVDLRLICFDYVWS
jgi:superfamily II DNA or RNA helicase